jgi:hypothetical protein
MLCENFLSFFLVEEQSPSTDIRFLMAELNCFVPVDRCLILAAGNGSRIVSLSCGIPKPLVPLCGVPLLEHVITSAREAGIGKQ